MGRKVRERKGAWVSKNRIVEQSFNRCAVASLCTVQLHERAAKGLGVGIMNHHGIKKGKLDSVGNSFLAGTRSDVSDRIHRASIALLASVCLSAAGPLAFFNGKRTLSVVVEM